MTPVAGTDVMNASSPFVMIRTARFILRSLTQADATSEYLGWLRSQDARRYIVTADDAPDLDALRSYIAEKSDRRDVLFLGIFAGAEHIGNIKFEPIDEASGVATMGILIGADQWRGRGVAPEVLEACADWLLRFRGIQRIELGVAGENPAAVRAYEKVGFRKEGVVGTWRDLTIVRMAWDIAPARRLALGTAQLGLAYGVANRTGLPSRAAVESILSTARSEGVRTVDTAAAYGESEARLGDAGVGGLNVITKLPPVPDAPGDVSRWVTDTVTTSISRLRVDACYAVLVHRSSDLLGVHGQSIYSALAGLREAGVVGRVGVSVYDPAELDALWGLYDLDIVQAPFNVLDRRLTQSGWLERLAQSSVEVHTRSAFLQGLLLLKQDEWPSRFAPWRDALRRWQEWVRSSGHSAAACCLAFVQAQPEISRIVVGVESDAQLREIARLMSEAGITAPDHLAVEDRDLIDPSRWPPA